MPIKGEIAEILDTNRVILNIGREDGVQRDMKFVIYAETIEIIDAHGRNLGRLEIPKAEVQVIDVQDNLSIAENTGFRDMLVSLDPFKNMRVREGLQIHEGQAKNLGNIDMTILKGDKVRQVP